jgi:ribokinase
MVPDSVVKEQNSTSFTCQPANDVPVKPKPSLVARPRIVVIGSSNTDLAMHGPRLPRAGETLLGGEFARHAGGKGANQAVAAARAGARVVFVGAHGDDEFGRAAKAGLQLEGIDVRHFREHRGVSSGLALIFVGGGSRENMIVVGKSANDLVSPADVNAASGEIARASAVVCQLEIPLDAVVAAGKLAASHGVPFILNPAPARRLPKRLLKLVHTLVPNAQEAETLAQTRDLVSAGRVLCAAGCGRVVVTLGARGVRHVELGFERRIAAPRVKPVDTVGAGDCFTAWLALGIAEGLPTGQAVERAVRAATLSVTRAGAQTGMPWRGEVTNSKE